jgi:hypothetical protein
MRELARHPRLWKFLGARFKPGEYLGLHLTIGLLVSLAAIWVFGGITEDVVHHDAITRYSRGSTRTGRLPGIACRSS